MGIPTQYPYDTRLNVLHKHLELIDERALSDAAPHRLVQPNTLSS